MIISLLSVLKVSQAASEEVSLERRQEVLELAVAYKFGEIPEDFEPSVDPVLQAIRGLSLAESRFVLEYLYVFNRAGYPQDISSTEELIPYARQRELAQITSRWAIRAQTEQVQIEELLPADLSAKERDYSQRVAEGLLLVLHGKAAEYLSGSEELARDTILFLLRKHRISLFAQLPDDNVIMEDAEAFMKERQQSIQLADYCGYPFIEGPGAQINYGLSGGSSGSAAWSGDNERYPLICDHVVHYPVVSQYFQVDHDDSYDGWCILEQSGGHLAWVARQRSPGGENVLYGGWKAQWCAVTGWGIAQHTRGK